MGLPCRAYGKPDRCRFRNESYRKLADSYRLACHDECHVTKCVLDLSWQPTDRATSFLSHKLSFDLTSMSRPNPNPILLISQSDNMFIQLWRVLSLDVWPLCFSSNLFLYETDLGQPEFLLLL